MTTLRHPDLRGAVAGFVAERLGRPPAEIEYEPLRGGLIASAVRRVTVRWRDDGRERRWRFVAKRLDPEQHRELAAHRELASRLPGRLAPALLGSAELAGGGEVLFLEWIRATRRWPWSDPAAICRATRRLSRVHRELAGIERPAELAAWDYERDLQEMAAATLDVFADLPPGPDWAPIRRVRRAVERLVATLPELRRQLLPAGGTWIHGDVHPGNVLIGRHAGAPAVTFVDWGRLRRGSPLEDLSSWLVSLGHWEPAARRHHDRLAAAYLVAAGRARRLTGPLRDAYWLAGASNALAGALRHHLLAAIHAADESERQEELGAARSWARVVRHADARWRAPVTVDPFLFAPAAGAPR